MLNAIIASTSTIHGSGYLEYLQKVLIEHFKESSEILFIPFARPSGITHDRYLEKIKKAFKPLGKNIISLHKFDDKVKAIKDAEAIFIGGGNTFKLVAQLYKYNLINLLSEALKEGKPYLGTSAGSNICGPTMQTTNDMPIVYPPSFKTLNCIPFNINAHYLDPDPTSIHKGETRDTRIKEFHAYNKEAVVGLREGSWLEAKNATIILKGDLTARIFNRNEEPYEVKPNFNFNTL